MANAKRLLIVDDSEIDRSILRNILSRCFEISEAENGYAALEMILKNKIKIDGVLLDISMPVLDGFNVLDILSKNQVDIPIILVTAEATAANVYRAAAYSIAGFISKPFEPQTILEKLSNIYGLENIPAAVEKKEESFSMTKTFEMDTYISKLTAIYKTFLKNINIDDSHYSRVSKLMEIMLVEYGLSKKNEIDTLDIKVISKASFFHDIGYMGIPTELIFTKEALNSTDREIYNSHTTMGANIIRLNNSESCKLFVKVCSDMCMHHHERYDGAGYPHRLKGSDNSIFSQLCGIASRFDSIFASRREVNEMQFYLVINELKIDKGAFSGELLDILSKCRVEILSLYKFLEENNILQTESTK